MAGHNKWSKVKRIKGAIDAKRGKLFSRLAKKIAVVTKLGGPDPDANARLRASARTQIMSNDNIKRAIKRGSGNTGGVVPGRSRIAIAAPDRLVAVVGALRSAPAASAWRELVLVPRTTAMVTGEQTAARAIPLHIALDNRDDGPDVCFNFDFPVGALERISGQN